MTALKDKINANGIEYVLVGDSYVPNVPMRDEEIGLGFYGRKHLNYLHDNQNEKMKKLLHSGRLKKYLDDVDRKVYNRKRELLAQYEEEFELSEEYRQACPIEWARNIHLVYLQIEMIVRAEYIYC